MITLIAIVLIMGVVVGALVWIKARLGDQVSLQQRDAALKIESARIAQIEATAAKEKAQRDEAFREKSSAVTSAADAAAFLHDQLSRPAGPKAS
jgi:hypothetical protein